ncbi:hypothetical protein GGI25_002904 [Coemansia spiralis]|uniref:Propionate--CoA ligase n=2 Tax=Coemansia TaxID=4863 RepID=A0A9W8KYM6_9FUNG|nr:hypothetical protein BX070DRAFT_222772 [Coemansia spiralis]KAJ1992377.1 hypothetical protein EDC05_002875 [Coemansia umbellata]KAJ2622242.1 hypothetical protein GGI26_003395 [Coemansia sp. RSA 1358]KAJ2677806.1 hypothetical protein GGI25_002904 [Coemansia spiralis]
MGISGPMMRLPVGRLNSIAPSVSALPSALVRATQHRLLFHRRQNVQRAIPGEINSANYVPPSLRRLTTASGVANECNVYKQERDRQRSLTDPEGFWMEAQKAVDWIQRPTRALETPDQCKPYRVLWFPDGKLNVCYNALDRHVKNGRAHQVALIHDSPVTQSIRKFTYEELLFKVKQTATMLRRNCVNKGDRVLLYMGAVPEAIIAMLACARLGAIHSVVFGGFASNELAKRIEDCHPKVIISSSCGIEGLGKAIAYKPLLDGALKLCKNLPNKVIVLQREQLVARLSPGEESWADAVDSIPENQLFHGYETVDSNHPLYILYTSGTTGLPKGVVRPSGGHAVVLLYTMERMYACKPGQVYWAASDLGWILGHSYICYGPLLNGSTTVLYEGKPVGTPDPSSFYRVMAEHKVTTFFTAPTALMILRREDPHSKYRKQYDLSNVKAMFLAGERCLPEIQRWWVRHITGVDDTGKALHSIVTPVKNVISDNWWQTETGSPLVGIEVGLSENGSELPPVKYGSAGMPVQGVDLRVLRIKDEFDEDTVVDAHPEEVAPGEIGNIVIKLPLPPGIMTTLWNDDGRFFDAYFRRFPGFYDTGDTGMVDSDGYVHILSRADDIINVAAHRISTSAIEEVVIEHNEIAEACVVARPHSIKGSVPVVIAVCKHHRLKHTLDQIKSDLVSSIRERVGPFTSPHTDNVVFVDRLPKTRSGKVLRKMIRSMIAVLMKGPRNSLQKCPIAAPATIEEEAVKDEIWDRLYEWEKSVDTSQ